MLKNWVIEYPFWNEMYSTAILLKLQFQLIKTPQNSRNISIINQSTDFASTKMARKKFSLSNPYLIKTIIITVKTIFQLKHNQTNQWKIFNAFNGTVNLKCTLFQMHFEGNYKCFSIILLSFKIENCNIIFAKEIK